MILDTPSGRIVDVARPSSEYNAWSLLAEWSLAKQAVSTDTALALVAVYGAVSLVADTNGVMPLEVIDTKAQSGKRVVQGGWMPTLLQHAPNADMTGIDVWVYVNACLMLRGNAYLAKLREDGTGRVTALYPVNPAQVYPYRGQDGRKLFRVSIQTGETYVDSVFTEDAILHIKGRSLTDPLVGASPIEHARHALGTQLAQQEYQARNYADGMLIKGVLTTPQANITPDAAARIKQQWRSAYQGTGNSHDVAVLHSGVTFQSVAMSPEDAQFIQTMRWGHTQIATMYKIPASRMNGESASLTYANQGQDDLFYDKQACLPLRRMIEAALNRDTDLFGPASAWVPKFNAEVMLQADIDTRFKVYRTAREIGVMSQNDILRAEDRPTIGAEGDDYTPLGASTTGVRGDVAARSMEQRAPEVHLHQQAQPITVNVPEQRVDVHVPAQAAPVVHVAAADAPEIRFEQPAPIVTVNVPEQPAPVVNVDVSAPSVQVDVAAPQVDVAAPNVQIEAHIDQPASKSVSIQRDGRGFITGAKVEGNA